MGANRCDILAADHLRRCPVVMVTSAREAPDIDRARELRVDSCAVGPEDLASFVDAMVRVGSYRLLVDEPQRSRGDRVECV